MRTTMPQDNKNTGQPKPTSQPGRGTTGGATGGATWTNNEIITLKQLASEKAPLSAISTKLRKPEDVIKAKAKELKLTLTSW